MVLFGVFIALMVIAVIVSFVKEANRKQNAETAKKQFQEKDEIKNILSSSSSQDSSNPSSLMQTHSGEQGSVTLSSTISAEEKQAQARRELMARLDAYKARKAAGDNVSAQSHAQAHSDIVYKDHAKYRVEHVPVMNSIGGHSDEGCSEHYDVRYVKLDKPIIPEHLELTELQKCIVYGEIINQPAFRRANRRY